MSYTRLNPKFETLSATSTAASGWTIAGESYKRYGPVTYFAITAKCTNAVTEGTEYLVCTLPWTMSFGVVSGTGFTGGPAANGELRIKPSQDRTANSNFYIRGFFV